MFGLVESDFSAARQFEGSPDAPGLLFYFGANDFLFSESFDGRRQVVAHEIEHRAQQIADILKEPDMFCAYNNGITVFARSVEVISSEAGGGLVRAEDFEIVDGGQTTAPLYHTQKKDRANIGNIFVQMKLTIIYDPEDVPILVPKISEYSKTQNKVQLADLAANQSPHPEIQTISNNILAPDPTGGSQHTYWFYERARGSYGEFRNLTARTPAQKRQFDAMS